MRESNRRHFLALSSSVGAVFVAGCTGDDNNGDESGNGSENADTETQLRNRVEEFVSRIGAGDVGGVNEMIAEDGEMDQWTTDDANFFAGYDLELNEFEVVEEGDGEATVQFVIRLEEDGEFAAAVDVGYELRRQNGEWLFWNQIEEEETGSNGTGETNGDEDNTTRSNSDTLLTINGPDSVSSIPWELEELGAFSGTGTDVTAEFSASPGLVILAYEETDGTGLGADLVQTDGDAGETLVINEVVSLDGEDNLDRLTGATTAAIEEDGTYLFEVEADSEWTIRVLRPNSPAGEIRTPPVSASGTGSAVMGPVEISNGATVSVTYDDGPFRTTLDMGALPENPDNWGFTTGDFIVTGKESPFEGSARAEVDGVSWIWLNGRNSWTVEVE